jgi:hypothetical protein
VKNLSIVIASEKSFANCFLKKIQWIIIISEGKVELLKARETRQKNFLNLIFFLMLASCRGIYKNYEN